MILVAILSLGIGLTLGLLGGGGSILTVPILVYAAALPAKSAIATSLLVVGIAASAGLVQHARAGRVRWRTGLWFGAAGMVGAYAAGRIAAFIPGEVLLSLFAAMMLVTAWAMLRKRAPADDAAPANAAGSPGKLPVAHVVLHGLVVGGVTGLVGAGGGFLVVPALVLLGGLPMRSAVATSLLVIAMKSFAGFAGYAGHVEVAWELAALVSAFAIVGAVIGNMLIEKIPQQMLRSVFGWFVVAMAVFMVAQQVPESVTGSAAWQAVFVDRWPFWVGGLAIASVVVALLYLDNKLLGVSTGCSELCAVREDRTARKSWRLRLLAGLVLGGMVSGAMGGSSPTLALGSFDELIGASMWIKVPVLLGAGLAVGYGARLARGCTSGHGIVGTAQLARSSWIATSLFMVAGFATTAALLSLGG